MYLHKGSSIIGIIARWLGSLVLAVRLFSVIYGLVSFFFIFRITILIALPAALLYLPFLITLQKQEGGQPWTVLFSGSLCGPAYIALWVLFGAIRGRSAAWDGDGLGPGLAACLVYALVVGFLTSGSYVIASKVFQRRQKTSSYM